MSKKTDRFGNLKHPGLAYRNYKANGGRDWAALQRNFRRKKRLRRISRLARRGQRPKRTMRPVPE